LSIRCDNRLAAGRVANGEAIELYEAVELMAACRCLYDLATLAAREFGTVKACRELWASTRDQFAGMGQAWESVPQNGELACLLVTLLVQNDFQNDRFHDNAWRMMPLK
jgi:hypothetical protein